MCWGSVSVLGLVSVLGVSEYNREQRSATGDHGSAHMISMLP